MPFKKGETGNPGGRPKVEQDVLAIARAAGPKAIERLISLIDHKDARIAATASEQVLNRGFGKPPQFQTTDAWQFKRACDITDDDENICST